MNIQENISLKSYNTFGIDINARFFTEIFDVDGLYEALSADQFRSVKKLILGGGSNVLFIGDYDGLIIKNNILGKEILSESNQTAIVRSGAGESWHELVRYCLDHELGGIENLSLIPGSVGAAPVQNIGAYGTELKDVFVSLEAMNRETRLLETFDKETCRFGYRDSIFKNELKNKYVITSVTLRLSKQSTPNIAYGAVKLTLEEMGVKQITPRAVSDAVIKIRQSKLPDPAEIGNAGSFFKNPIISREKYNKLKTEFPDMAVYPLDDENYKAAAGWLIEQCGWKGKRIGNVGMHEKQALVLVNYGNAEGEEVLQLITKVQTSVKEKFGIELQPEVNIISSG